MRIFVLGRKELIIVSGIFLAGIIGIVSTVVGAQAISTAKENRLLPIYSVETDKKEIALTFDAAWGNKDTDQLISVLDKNDAKATFFLTGEWIDKYPADVKKFFEKGHELANHSDAHPHINKLSSEALLEDIAACNRKLEAITGTLPKLYRGPYGEYNNTLIEILSTINMKCIQWDVDSLDYKKKPVDEIVKKVCNNVKNGSIVLFHNDVENTAKALEIILPKLKEQGYSFVRVSDMIYKDNYIIDHQGRQWKNSTE